MNARMQSALSFIPADHRDTWVSMAMAIKSECGESGFDIWNDWSQTADNYHAASARSVWKSCKGAGVTVGSLFHEARAHGWRDDEKHEKPSQELLQARQRASAERLTHEGVEREKAQQPAKLGGFFTRPNQSSTLICIQKAGRMQQVPCGGRMTVRTCYAFRCAWVMH